MFLLAKHHHHMYVYIPIHSLKVQICIIFAINKFCITKTQSRVIQPTFYSQNLSYFEYVFYIFCFSLSTAIYYYINKGYFKFVSNTLTTLRSVILSPYECPSDISIHSV